MIVVNQIFSISQLTKRGVIDEQLGDHLEDSLKNLAADQLTYFSTSRTMTPKDILSEAKTNSVFNKGTVELQKSVHHDKKFRGKPSRYTVKTSNAFTISGQTPGIIHSLPLEKSLKSTALEMKIDRKEFPLIWEVSRLATIREPDLQQLLDAITLQIKSEIALLDGKLEDAYIFAHSPDRIHTRLYENNYGMKKYTGYQNAPDESVLFIKVSDLQKKLNLPNRINQSEMTVKSAKNYIDQINTTTFGIQNIDKGRGLFLRSFEDPNFQIPYITKRESMSILDLPNYRRSLKKLSGKYFRDHPDHQYSPYQIISQYHDLKAVTFDGSIRYAWGTSPWPYFDEHLAYFYLLKTKFNKFKNVENIVLNQEYLKDIQGSKTTITFETLKHYGLKKEVLINHPALINTNYETDIFWLSVQDAERYMKDHEETFKPLLERIEKEIDLNSTKKHLWSDPLAGS